MQFLLLGYDFKDENALDRRMAVRESHIQLAHKNQNNGNLLFAVAMLDDEGKMNGSMLVCDFEDRAELDAYLEIEPYVTGKVWEKIDIIPCKIGPSFAMGV